MGIDHLYERIEAPFPLLRVKILQATPEELLQLSKERNLALSADEMGMLRAHFESEGRNPTDVELEATAQAWSEHCSYKSSWPILESNVFRVEAPQNLLVIQEDAGLVSFDDEWAYVVAMESHNHPSALDPVGGAETGVGGILRDVVCMGAQPIALLDPLFFGPLDHPYDRVPAGIKHPLYLFRNVVAGIRDYGNRVGIPTVGGMVGFHPGYVSNCLVNVCCVGMVKKDRIIRSRAENVGDVFILAGGRTGRDGIHGVSGLASQVISEDSEEVGRSAVQMGDSITKEPLMHACLQCIDEDLVNGFKDLGGGGLSSCSGELAFDGGNGAEIDLDKVPLKVADMAAWEVWVSESQERMMLVVPPEKVDRVLAIFAAWDVEANAIGTVTDTKRMKLSYQGVHVADLDLEFYTGAVRYNRPYRVREHVASPSPEPAADLGEALDQVLASPNVASMAWVVQQYDTIVRGATVAGPLQGEYLHQGPGDASVLKPLADSNRGLAMTTDVNPYLCELDPYWGGMSALEESMRNVIAVGGRPHSWADNLNFGNPEDPDRLGEFKAATDGMYHLANALGVPAVSGNVSLYNEGPTGPIPPTPAILMMGLVEDVGKTVTMDFKAAGNLVYLIGQTHDELAGSEYLRVLGDPGRSRVPAVNPSSFKRKMDSLLEAMDQELIRACHDVAGGGLAVALLEMLFGSAGLGLVADLTHLPGTARRGDIKIFSESNGRFVVEVEPGRAAEFEAIMDGVALCRLGALDESGGFSLVDGGETIVERPVSDAYRTWSEALPKLLG
ncbi:MAG: phosphoribosylformylglycinamidine synthase subunit PurL [Armatimonadia bacterium]|nr:phosphoribosylformylglycinamidine synthase subunit PurL [Armatimonadia bacterium]